MYATFTHSTNHFQCYLISFTGQTEFIDSFRDIILSKLC